MIFLALLFERYVSYLTMRYQFTYLNVQSFGESINKQLYFDSHLLNAYKDPINIQSPIQDGLIQDWDALETLWNYSISSYVKVDCRETPLLLAEKPYNTAACRHK